MTLTLDKEVERFITLRHAPRGMDYRSLEGAFHHPKALPSDLDVCFHLGAVDNMQRVLIIENKQPGESCTSAGQSNLLGFLGALPQVTVVLVRHSGRELNGVPLFDPIEYSVIHGDGFHKTNLEAFRKLIPEWMEGKP